MNVELITKEDLQRLRFELLDDIKQLLGTKQQPGFKEWLKAAEVRKLLSISDGKLQGLRINGMLRSSKIGGVHYYRHEDIVKLLEGGLN